MTPAEMQRQIRAAWNNARPESRLDQLASLRELVPLEEHPFFDAMCDLVRGGVADDHNATVVILVHGIRTDAAWHQRVKQQFGPLSNVNTVSVGYGFFSVVRFLGPFRKRPIQIVTQEIEDIRSQEPHARLVVIAHSFGTYIISKILQDRPKLAFDRIILCGAVVSTAFPWNNVAANLTAKSVINDVGTRDFLPVLASCSTLGYGSSGRLGFQKNRVTDRFFDYGHSGFFTDFHIQKFWAPFVTDGVIVSSSWTVERPQTPYFLNLFGSSRLAGMSALGLVLSVCISALVLLMRAILSL